MGTTRTLADGEAFVQGRSQATAAKLVSAAAEADLKGSVKTTYDGYIAPVEVVEAAGFGDFSTVSSTPENPADHSDEPPVKQADAENVDEQTDETPEGEEPAREFDPTAATVDEVKEYLAGADDEERARVLEAEATSAKPRKGVLDLAATPEEGK